MNNSKKSVILNIRKANLIGDKAGLQVAFSGAKNGVPSKFSKPVKGLKIVSKSLDLESKGLTLSPKTDYTKAKLTAKNLNLSKGSDSIELEVIDGVPMTVITIGQSKIGIGRDRKSLKEYSWSELHELIGYGQQVIDQLRFPKNSSYVDLFVYSKKNITLELKCKSSPRKDAQMILLTGKEKSFKINRV
jgi:hypothetical protein